MKKSKFSPLFTLSGLVIGGMFGLVLDILWARDDEQTADVCRLKQDVEVLKLVNCIKRVDDSDTEK